MTLAPPRSRLRREPLEQLSGIHDGPCGGRATSRCSNKAFTFEKFQHFVGGRCRKLHARREWSYSNVFGRAENRLNYAHSVNTERR